jgi:hypothetical protein
MNKIKAITWLKRIPLTLQIIIALVLAIILGMALGAGNPSRSNATLITNLAIPAEVSVESTPCLSYTFNSSSSAPHLHDYQSSRYSR